MQFQNTIKYNADLKPENLLIVGEGAERGTLKLCDFGLSRSFNDPLANSRLTNGQAIATLWYRSPELLLGVNVSEAAMELNDPFQQFEEMIKQSDESSNERFQALIRPKKSNNMNNHDNNDILASLVECGVDTWACGCIVGMMLTGDTLFRGKPALSNGQTIPFEWNQLNLICEFIDGTELDWVLLHGMFIEQFSAAPPTKSFEFQSKYDNSELSGLVRKLLVFQPTKRLSIKASMMLYYDYE